MISTVVRAIMLAGVLLARFAYSDTVVSVNPGSWQNPGTWSTGMVPANADVVVGHEVWIPDGAAVTVASLAVTGHLIIQSGATLRLLAPPSTSAFIVSGVLECEINSTVEGTSVGNTRFDFGSRYIHRQGPLGFIPLATWDPGSTFQISGFIDDGYINLAHSTSWHQTFGNVEYDCPQQSVFVVDLNGHLQDIRGNLIIRNTNNKTLRLSTTQQVVIRIGRDFIIEGTSQVWITTNSPNCVIDIGGNFEFRSQATAASYLATRGNVSLSVRGGWTIDAQALLRMASSASDSTGMRQATVSLAGNLEMIRGSLIAPPTGGGRGVIVFNGQSLQTVNISSGSVLAGNLEYAFTAGSRVNLQQSILTSERGSITVDGILELGSTDSGGALQLGSSGGNIRVPGLRTFNPTSTIVYNGSARQFIGNGHPSACHVIVDNPEGVGLTQPVLIKGDLSVSQGEMRQSGYPLTVEGDVKFIRPGMTLDKLILSGSKDQTLDMRAGTIGFLEVNKTLGSVEFLNKTSIANRIEILSTGTKVRSNGNLTLLSSGDDAGRSATVGPVPAGSSIEGDVTVERFMSGEGRMYRYISSPVSNATVASLMDDFPVTGTFNDPSQGAGIHSSNPSLFKYDEALGEQQAGWKNFPKTGFAATSMLRVGEGYAAFVRNEASTVLDFTGPLNQGEVVVPLGYTMHQGRGNGWHLVGNPYAASVDWDAPALEKIAVSNVIAIRDNGGRRFRYWDGDDTYEDIPEGRIAAGQSFWVRATGTGASLTFREECKSIDAAFFRRRAMAVPSVMISINDGHRSDRMMLRLRRQACDSLDAWDGVKLLNDTLNLSTVTSKGERLAIDCRRVLPGVIPLRLTELVPGCYSISVVPRSTLRRLRYFLRDGYLHRTTEIELDDSISFDVTADVASADPDRFTVYIKNAFSSALIADSVMADKVRRDSTLVYYPNIEASLRSRSMHDLYDSLRPPVPGGVLTWNKSVRFYPNPVARELIVEGNWDDDLCDADKVSEQVELYNAAGIRVASGLYNVQREPLTADQEIQRRSKKMVSCLVVVGGLSPGEYILKITCGIHAGWLRFIKI